MHVFRYVNLNIKQYMQNIFKRIFTHIHLIIFGIYFFLQKHCIYLHKPYMCTYMEIYGTLGSSWHGMRRIYLLLSHNFYWNGNKNCGLHQKISQKTVYYTEIHEIIIIQTIFWCHDKLSEFLSSVHHRCIKIVVKS